MPRYVETIASAKGPMDAFAYLAHVGGFISGLIVVGHILPSSPSMLCAHLP